MPPIQKVAVVGVGLMGSGIAEITAKAGIDTIIREISDELLDAGMARLRASLDRGVAKQKLTQEERDAALARITPTTRLQDFADVDLVIEAIVENPQQKMQLFQVLDGICRRDTIFGTNTSSCSVTDLMAVTHRHDRVVGLHFFNPVPVMKLVEIVRTMATDDEVVRTLKELCTRVGKEPIVAEDRSGFIVNRLLVPYLLDAIRVLEEGYGTVEDIDKGMTLGTGHPMGPFTLLDLVGLDTTLYISEIMFEEYREKRFSAPSLLRRMVAAGRLGRKSGRGFYDYAKTGAR
jgi:3-hydroxybutyryl-CoA dehydrogenase